MKKLFFASAMLLSLSSYSYALTQMTGDEVKNSLTDKTITTVAVATLNNQIVNNAFTGYFNKDGTFLGSFATAPDGNPQTDQGTWQVKADGNLCFQWQHWDNAKEICVTLYKLSNAILVIGPNNRFETLILNTNIQDGNQVNQSMTTAQSTTTTTTSTTNTTTAQ